MTLDIRRRSLIKVGAASAVSLGIPFHGVRAQQSEFTYKFASNMPMAHPINIRAKQVADAVRAETAGRVDIQLFPNSQLGSDTDMLSQVRSGGIEFFTLSGLILSTLVPAAAITGIGFAFNDYDAVWKALDGELGAHVRKEIGKSNLVVMERIWDNGFRQITSSTKPIQSAADLKGFKIRVPVSPLWTSMFEAFAASPVSINFSEVYSALQTKIVEGQENPLVNIDTAKLYEVQKYCSMTRHMWDGFLMLGNGRAWRALPADLQAIVARNFDASAIDQRADYVKANDALRAGLEAKGMVFNEPEPEAFRQALIKAGFYTKWKEKYGSEAWAVLEQYAGKVG